MNRSVNQKVNLRKEEIYRIAARLFREKGFNATGMRDIALEVGVEAASLYNHIRSKSELLQQCCFRVAGDFSRQLEEQEQQNNKSSTSKLEAILRFHIRSWITRLDEVLVATHESKYLEEPWHSEFMQERRRYMKRIESIIRQGMDNGEIREADPYPIMLTFMSTVRGIEFWHRKQQEVTAIALEEGLVDMIIKGMLPANSSLRG
jgi:TetR/AcrR family transcriptional regulator, cholesterol catabolism regulator